MVAYHGGKQRHGKAIKEVMVQVEHMLGVKPLPFFDPFVGMGGVARQFAKGNDRRVIVSDLNPNVVALLRKIKQPNWAASFPSQCSRPEYDALKKSKRVSAKKAFVGIACSFNGNYFRGFRNPDTQQSNFINSFRNGLAKLAVDMQSAEVLDARSYDTYHPQGCLIFCDPPYIGNNIATPYFSGFDFPHFWDTVREWSKSNIVFITEMQAPEDFVCIWTGITRKKNMYRNEPMTDKLFIHHSIWVKLEKRSKSATHRGVA